ncbi:MAG: ankyrin repeat domain-containing protein, partial [Opitutaceae bacterium]
MKRIVLVVSLLGFAPMALAAAVPPADPLLEAVRRNDAAKWQALLAAKADLSLADTDGNTALHHAALNHDLAAVQAFVAAGAKVDAKNAADATPLLYGAAHSDIVRVLLARGANPNTKSKAGFTPLMVALAVPDSYPAVRQLIDAGADQRAGRRADEEIMLGRAIFGGDQRSIALLLEKGVELNPKAGSSPLLQAAFVGDLATAKVLIERGADLNLVGNFTGSPVNQALYAGQRDFARLLIEKGANLTHRSPRGHGTPTMVWSAYNQDGDDSIARLMVAKQADVNLANEEGATALSWALRTGAHTPLVAYLKSVGAKAPEPARAKSVPARAVPESAAARAAQVRERLPATLALLEKSSAAFLENAFVKRANCVSCHGQDLSAVALEAARGRGLKVDDAELGRIVTAVRGMWVPRIETARQMTDPIPDPIVSLGYGLMGLHAVRYAPDAMTDAMVHFIVRSQRPDGSWLTRDQRPPMEDGPMVGTAWA